MRKEVKSEDLVIGEVYASCQAHSQNTTFLKYVGRNDSNDLEFTHFGGVNGYVSNSKGIIPFCKNCDFYFPMENELIK